MKKKPLRKTKKNPAKKKASAKKTSEKKKTVKRAAQKPVGAVTHYFTHIKVAIVRFKEKVKTGTRLHYKGATTDFIEEAKSMQYDHEAVAAAPKGKQIGIKVKKRVREGDLVYRAE